VVIYLSEAVCQKFRVGVDVKRILIGRGIGYSFELIIIIIALFLIVT
jgi:hypothetical protein